MLIRNADIWRRGVADLRIAGGTISQIGQLTARSGETAIEANGGALLPGLHDHHIHLAATAVGRNSVTCGPPSIANEEQLATVLAHAGMGWLRGIGYHESVAGMLDAPQLDRLAPHRPVRIQHRSGRMWFLNSLAVNTLLSSADPPPGLESDNGRWTGRLFDEDLWLRETMGGPAPDFAALSAELAGMGVIGLTDMSPANDRATAAHFAGQQRAGLSQHCVLAGTLDLAGAHFTPQLCLGPAKLHLHEAALPDLDDTIAFIRAAHEQGRTMATHCTTETELVFSLAALEAAGVERGDRIEHAGIAPDALVSMMIDMSLHVVSQPHFIAERGGQYLRDVEPRDHPNLYRLAALQRAGITLAAGSDAPYGGCDPWHGMRAAVSRRTDQGVIIGENEALDPESALALYLADPLDLSTERRIEAGAPADLCLLDRPWQFARTRLLADDVRLTMIAGSIVHDRVDQTPRQRQFGPDPLARKHH